MAWPGMYCACSYFDYRGLGHDGRVLQKAVAEYAGKIARTRTRKCGTERTL